MKSRTGLLALLCLALANIGCVARPHVVNTVPCWKGLPCLMIAPSSLEAHVWREHLRARHAGQPSCDAMPCECDVCASVEYSESPMLDPESY